MVIILFIKNSNSKFRIALYIALCVVLTLYFILSYSIRSSASTKSPQLIEIILYFIVLILFLVGMLMAILDRKSLFYKLWRFAYDIITLCGILYILRLIIELYI